MKRILTGSVLTVFVQGIGLLLIRKVAILPLTAVFLVIFGISAWEMRLLTRKTGKLREFAKEFVPFLVQTVCILAADILLCLTAKQNPEVLITLIAFAAAEVCCAMTVFVIGAASTALYGKS